MQLIPYLLNETFQHISIFQEGNQYLLLGLIGLYCSEIDQRNVLA